MQSTTRRLPLLMATAAMAALTALPGAHAEDAAPARPAEPREIKTTLETVITQGQRVEEDAQTVPVVSTIIAGEALENKFAQDLRDLSNAAPNVQLEPVGQFQNSASFFIRGQGSTDIESAVDPGVAIFVDNVYQARISNSLSDFLDIESVEILRGPQGTLFGRNTISGAVLVNHAKPDASGFKASGSVLAGNYGRLDFKGMVNIPLVQDKLAFRAAFKSTNMDGYYTNTLGGDHLGGNDRFTVLPSLRFTPNDNLEVLVRGEFGRMRDDTYVTKAQLFCRDNPISSFFGIVPGVPPGSAVDPVSGQPTGGVDNDAEVTLVALAGLFFEGLSPQQAADKAASFCGHPITGDKRDFAITSIQDRGNKSDADIWGISGEVNYTIPDFGTLTYIANYRRTNEAVIFESNHASLDLFAGDRDEVAWQTSHELRFASDFSDKIDMVGGVYYLKQEYTLFQNSYGILFEPNLLLNGPFSPTFTHPDTASQAQYTNQATEAWAVFGQVNWHITDRLTLLAGARYTNEKKSIQHCGLGAGDPSRGNHPGTVDGCNDVPLWLTDPTLPPVASVGAVSTIPRWALSPAYGFDAGNGAEGGCVPVITGNPADGQILCNNRLTGKQSWNNFSPRAGVEFAVTDDIFTFFTWTRGFRSGGFNGRATSASTIGPFGPENVDNYEVGVKTEWFDNHLRFNVNAFWTEITGLQRALIRPAVGGGGQETVTSNIGSVTNRGFEIEMQAAPADGLMVWSSLGFLNNKERGFCADGDGYSGTDPNAPPPPPNGLPGCGTPEKVFGATGSFLGWLVPTDNSNLVPGTRAPKWTLSAGLSYQWLVGNAGSLTVSADWMYRTKMYMGAARLAELQGTTQYNGEFLSAYRKSTNIFNASVTWHDVDDRYKVSVFVKNLTNEHHMQSLTLVAGLFEYRTNNEPRTWGVEVGFDF